VRRAAVGVLLAACCAGCVAPAPGIGAYQGKAARAAGAALSQVETARTAVAASQQGRLPHAYLEVMLSTAEDDLGSVQQAFDSVQPPDDPRADRIRTDLDDLLGQAADGLGALRIAARRHDAGELASTAHALELVASGLSTFDPAGTR
jgi:hypothetical protein